VRTNEAPTGRAADQNQDQAAPRRAAGGARPGRTSVAERDPGDRERTAERLLRSTATRSYDPDLDIDWSQPPVPGKIYLPEHRCTLYGTAMYERLTPEQRVELGKHETASVARAGIMLELVLLRMLSKLAYHGDPGSAHVQYALAEMAEECRHTTMFARMIDWMGVPSRQAPRLIHTLGGILPAIAYGPAMWGAILIGEEITDRYQREMVADESIQPLVRMVNRIHIMEEARHIGFARAELVRSAARLRRAELLYHRGLLGRIALVIARNLVGPEVYLSVGLDPGEARRVALANPAHQETVRFGGEKIVAFLDGAGMIGAPGTRLWRKSFMLP
jgi:hypothetical protein